MATCRLPSGLVVGSPFRLLEALESRLPVGEPRVDARAGGVSHEWIVGSHPGLENEAP